MSSRRRRWRSIDGLTRPKSFQIAERAFGIRHGRACPGHPRLLCISVSKAWMPGTRPGMTG
ncbi:hypothetical protein D4Q52_03910 [Rhodopseudomonas palustris]|uniref:Uncharacterized protein n=1 Tax=Rhodopseudomonas palustris TaxID=1076 RepID=A0A418VLL1_RHOPL|nr:hypothetical protein D4Q52_03910 [Rhodopseudomonas palustris]